MVYTYMQILSLPKKKVFEGKLPKNWREKAIEWLEIKMDTPLQAIVEPNQFFGQLWKALEVLEEVGLKVEVYRDDLKKKELKWINRKIKEFKKRKKELEGPYGNETIRERWERWWNV